MNPNLLTTKDLDSRHSLLWQFKCAACSSRHVLPGLARAQVVARGIQAEAGHGLATGIGVFPGYPYFSGGLKDRFHCTCMANLHKII